MTEISEIQVHVEQIIDLLHKVKLNTETLEDDIDSKNDEISKLNEANAHLKSLIENEVDLSHHAQISGMGGIRYEFDPKTSQDFVNAFNEFIQSQQIKYTGNAPELQFV